MGIAADKWRLFTDPSGLTMTPTQGSPSPEGGLGWVTGLEVAGVALPIAVQIVLVSMIAVTPESPDSASALQAATIQSPSSRELVTVDAGFTSNSPPGLGG